MRTSFPVAVVLSKLSLTGLIFVGTCQDSFAQEFANAQQAHLTFSYEQSRPRIINGQPVYGLKYCACIESVTVSFPNPPVRSTVFGNITLKGEGGSVHALSVVEVGSGGKNLKLRLASGRSCNDLNPSSSIEFGKDLRFERGGVDAVAQRMMIPWPLSSNQLPNPAQKTLPLKVMDSELLTVDEEEEGYAEEVDVEGLLDGVVLKVQPEAINAGFNSQLAWEQAAKTHAVYQKNILTQFQIGDPFAPTSDQVLVRHFASPDLTYVLNRAGSFFSKLWTQKKTVFLADMSNANGETPSVGSGQNRIFRHPVGSHIKGQDVDIPYIKQSNGTDLDWEANFWLFYSLMQNTGVDLIITAYKSEFIALAQQAYRQGLINHIALARFDSVRMLQDTGLGHDDHLHVSVRNGDNDSISKKFSLSDNVYNCYLKLKPAGRGVGGNFCEMTW